MGEGSDRKDSELAGIGRDQNKGQDRRGKNAQHSPQKSPSQAEKGWLPQGATIQAGVWILRLNRRLQPKAATAPKRGRGAGTGAAVYGVKIRVFVGEVLNN